MTVAEQIELACLLEATARKPGNVHPAAHFSDLGYEDFTAAAQVIGEPLALTRSRGLGRAIYDAVQATRQATGTNVNLGIIFLLAPLAHVPRERPLADGIGDVLRSTTVEDAEWVYAAIQLAQPGGMGKVSDQDIHAKPTVTLREAMMLAADRDAIAHQYVSDFELVFAARSKLLEIWQQLADWEAATIYLHVWLMSRQPDTLIARKCGSVMATEASARADALLKGTEIGGRLDHLKLQEFDRWLRADGHRRNPGTTADLIAATLFSAFRDAQLNPPTREEIQQRAAMIRIESTTPDINRPSSEPCRDLL
ncbi:triphosphoribosyl-dephospho-CoA synthase [Schlesneria paludicola]|uniref:triphosphoribosyl-dephospho-CoA synthase n=1 Tax=Schlesneria paludicola TaxID=360056 RepID=UPI00029A3F49|nr:triphosphoribosyl-dephospho-CoA synthase [Schlesneria paludicola]